jgi:hypothetical protein
MEEINPIIIIIIKTYSFHYMRVTTWTAEEKSALWEGICTMELFIVYYYYYY